MSNTRKRLRCTAAGQWKINWSVWKWRSRRLILPTWLALSVFMARDRSRSRIRFGPRLNARSRSSRKRSARLWSTSICRWYEPSRAGDLYAWIGSLLDQRDAGASLIAGPQLRANQAQKNTRRRAVSRCRQHHYFCHAGSQSLRQVWTRRRSHHNQWFRYRIQSADQRQYRCLSDCDANGYCRESCWLGHVDSRAHDARRGSRVDGKAGDQKSRRSEGKENCGIEPWLVDRFLGQVHSEEKRVEPGSGSDIHPDGRRRGTHRRSQVRRCGCRGIVASGLRYGAEIRLSHAVGCRQGTRLSVDGDYDSAREHQERPREDHELCEGSSRRHCALQKRPRFRPQGYQKNLAHG